jgi:hypothetical protein
VAGDDLITAYLRELRASVAHLRDADDMVAEAEDHLRETADRLRDGRTEAEAAAEAVARFGSAAYLAKVCTSESKRGAAVPTRRTRYAGLVLFLAPVMLVVGTIGNYSTGKTWVHGMWVFLSALSLPALLYGLWGLRKRHGGLGRAGLVALVVAIVAAPVSMLFSYIGLLVFPVLLGLAIVVFAVEMLRARILPVVPLVLLGASPLLVFALIPVSRAVTNEWYTFAGALAPVVVALMWLGWVMWREPAVDRHGVGPLATAQ